MNEAPSLNASCYYINLDRSTDRRKHMEAQLVRLGVTALRFPAVDGSTLDDATCKRLNPGAPRMRDLSKGEIGCFLSHRTLWEALVASDQSYLAILEDDIILSDDAASFLMDFSWIPADIDLVKLDSIGWPTLLSGTTPVIHDRRLAKVHSKTVCTGGYIISKEAARRMLAKTAEFVAPVDIVMFDPLYRKPSDLPYWQLSPAITVQQRTTTTETGLNAQPLESTIDPEGDRFRTKNRRSWTYIRAKIIREFSRPFKQLKSLLRTIFLFFTCGARWQDVPFRR